MKIVFTRSFIKDYRSLPNRYQTNFDKKLKLLKLNPNHPSLNVKKMRTPNRIWEGRITKGYRFTFQVKNQTYIMRRMGSHDILKKP